MREPVSDKVDFSGQVAAVTGGAQGIGRAICEAFAADGADVAVVDIQADRASETAREIRDTYDCASTAVDCDVTDYEDAKAMVETVVDELGRLDFLINNAGTGNNKPTFQATGPDDWETAVGVCFFGTMNCTHAALDHMVQRGSGAIVNFASDSFRGNDPGLSVYGGAKAANVSFSSTLSKEVGEDGVRVNCVSPGTTRTPATADWLDEHAEKVLESYALDRLGDPEDIANAVAFLCSDAASWITGQTLSVNGGYIRG